MKAAILLSAALLSGCATMTEHMGTPDRFAQCAAADVMTTAIGLSMNTMHEINPLTKALYIPSLGRVLGTIVPVVGLSIAGYYLLKHIDKPELTAIAATVTCAAAVKNIVVMQ